MPAAAMEAAAHACPRSANAAADAEAAALSDESPVTRPIIAISGGTLLQGKTEGEGLPALPPMATSVDLGRERPRDFADGCAQLKNLATAAVTSGSQLMAASGLIR